MRGLRGRDARSLSGGERARVFLARALATEAPCLIADEPLAGLDPGHQLEAMTLLCAQARAGRLVVVILHDLALAGAWCDRLLLLHEGRLAAEGLRPDAVLSSPLVRARETAAEIARALGAEPETDERLSPGTDADTLRAAVAGRGDTVIVVGHQPDCTRITAEIGGDPSPVFPPAGLAVLEL